MNSSASNDISMALTTALERLVDADSHLLTVEASERAMSHRIGMYLQQLLPNWDVDCEYNRDGNVGKWIALIERDPGDDDGCYILPDIIVHKRGTAANVLVVEVKKSSNRTGAQRDLAKLRSCLQPPLSYSYGAFVMIRTDDSIADAFQITWLTG